MKLELLILTITGFVLLNTYFEGKLIQKLKSYEKYYKMGLIAFVGLCIYLFIKKHYPQINISIIFYDLDKIDINELQRIDYNNFDKIIYTGDISIFNKVK